MRSLFLYLLKLNYHMHKPLILLILCSLTILCNHSFSQQKLIKLYEKRDFEKADKKVNPHPQFRS